MRLMLNAGWSIRPLLNEPVTIIASEPDEERVM
jgi:hypothetical protein